jgi:hypothetical protein
MIKIPVFDPSNLGIGDKIAYVNNNMEEYKALTNYDTPIGYINFILPGYMTDKPDLKANPISPYLIDKELVASFYDQDIMLYINYFCSQDDALERIEMYSNDYIIKEKRVSPSWKIVVFLPLHSVDNFAGQDKFNLKYGLQLVGPDINLMNIQKNIDAGIHHFNLVFMEINQEMKLKEANQTLIKELSTKYPEIQFLIYSIDADKLETKSENIRAVVGSAFWKKMNI